MSDETKGTVGTYTGLLVDGYEVDEAFPLRIMPTFARPNGSKRTIGFGLRCTRDVDNMAQLLEQSMEIINELLDTDEGRAKFEAIGLRLEVADDG